ncbi:MAG: class I SAM-dependent methyltransferase [Planctomycetes bacterium]|nr:class I SAM-dependent methyltransferase [Planctomycetota bacterium]
MAGLDETRLCELIRAGDQLWQRHRERCRGAFHGFVPSDARDVHDRLAALRARCATFVELGSGAGTNTVIADLLGYEAVGIEIEPWLCRAAEELAEQFGSGARFVQGSFLPRGFRIDDLLDPDFHVTYDDSAPAWDDLDHELADFDVVYAFPWPGEEALFDALIDEYGRPGQLLLTWHAESGFRERIVR